MWSLVSFLDWTLITKKLLCVILEQQELYFLLCDALPEDRILREQLQQRRLVSVCKKTRTCDCQFRSAALGSVPTLCDISIWIFTTDPTAAQIPVRLICRNPRIWGEDIVYFFFSDSILNIIFMMSIILWWKYYWKMQM